MLQWPLLPHAEHTIVFLDDPAGCVVGPVPDDVPGWGSDVLFFPLVGPGPLPDFPGAPVAPLVVPLHSHRSW